MCPIPTFARCRVSYTLRASSPDVTTDDVKYDASHYARPPKTTTTTTFWTSESRPPCQHWPPCNPDLCLTATTPTTVRTSPAYRSTRLLRTSDPHIILSPMSAAESGHLWEALGRRSDSTGIDGRLSSPQPSRCLLHSPSSVEITSVDIS